MVSTKVPHSIEKEDPKKRPAWRIPDPRWRRSCSLLTASSHKLEEKAKRQRGASEDNPSTTKPLKPILRSGQVDPRINLSQEAAEPLRGDRSTSGIQGRTQ